MVKIGGYLLTSNLVCFFFVNVISLPNVGHTQVSFEGLIDLSWAFKLGSNSSRGLPLRH
jgi:hypothetical protein